MKPLRLAVGVTAVCVALITASEQAHADIVNIDISIDDRNITVPRPTARSAARAVFLPGDCSQHFALRTRFRIRARQSGVQPDRRHFSPASISGPNPAQMPFLFTDSAGSVSQGPVLMPLKSCGNGISLMCLQPTETFVGNIAYASSPRIPPRVSTQ